MNNGSDGYKIHHIGFIVADIDKTIKHFKAFYCLDEFRVYDFMPLRAWSYGKEIFDYKLKIAMGSSAGRGTRIEIIQPLQGEGAHKDFLLSGSSGMHHICLEAGNNYDEWRSRFAERGYRIIFEAEAEDESIGYRRSLYAEDPVAGMVIEIKEKPYFRK